MAREYYEKTSNVVVDGVEGTVALPYWALCAAEFRYKGKTYDLVRYRYIELHPECPSCCFESEAKPGLSEDSAKIEKWLSDNNIFDAAERLMTSYCSCM